MYPFKFFRGHRLGVIPNRLFRRHPDVHLQNIVFHFRLWTLLCVSSRRQDTNREFRRVANIHREFRLAFHSSTLRRTAEGRLPTGAGSSRRVACPILARSLPTFGKIPCMVTPHYISLPTPFNETPLSPAYAPLCLLAEYNAKICNTSCIFDASLPYSLIFCTINV